MTESNDFNEALRDARERDDEAICRAQEAEVDKALAAMSDAEFAYRIGRLIEMLEEAGQRRH